MKIRIKLIMNKVFLVTNQLFKAIFYGSSPFFIISGILNKYPKIATHFPRFQKFIEKRYCKNIPKHFIDIYLNKLEKKEKGDVYDIFLSFFLLDEFVPKNGWTILDIGAFKGFYTLLCSSLVGDKGRVLAVEPNQNQYLQLKEIVKNKKNENVTLLDFAISSKNESITLNISENVPSTSSVFKNHTSKFDTNYKKTIVEGVTLDTLIEKENLKKIDLIKIDVEGAELDVLLGAEKTLMQNMIERLIVEVHQDVTGIKSIKKILRKNRYRIDAIIKTTGERSFLYSSFIHKKF